MLQKEHETLSGRIIIFALAVKAAFIALGIFGIATMWEAVFGDMGVALIAVFNAMRVMRN